MSWIQSEPFVQQSLLMCIITDSVTWLILLWILRTFNLQRHQVRKKGRICLNQSVVHIHPFPPLSPHLFYLPPFNSVAKGKLFSGTKNIGRWGKAFASLNLHLWCHWRCWRYCFRITFLFFLALPFFNFVSFHCHDGNSTTKLFVVMNGYPPGKELTECKWIGVCNTGV